MQLEKFDVISGMDLIQQIRIKLDWDLFRELIVGGGIHHLLQGLARGVGKAKPRHEGSAGTEQEERVAAKFTAPSQHEHANKERQLREQICKNYPDLCSDSLPLEGPSATLPDGTPYKVRLQL